jgi:hypothetical protein
MNARRATASHRNAGLPVAASVRALGVFVASKVWFHARGVRKALDSIKLAGIIPPHSQT